jgi:hypothetical protein
MGDAAIMARLHWSAKDNRGPFGSSVMLFQCSICQVPRVRSALRH